MPPEVVIQYLVGSGSARPELMISGQDPTWNRELFHAIRALRYGLYKEVPAHELRGFAAAGEVQLSLESADSDLGLLRSGTGQTFHWHHTSEGWKRVEDLLAPFCSHVPCPTATVELETCGDARVVFARQPLEAHLSGDARISGWIGRRHCSRHPLESAAALCHRCCTALCRACAEIQDGRWTCAAGCEPSGELHFYHDGDAEFGSLLLISSRLPANRELFHAIRSLRLGRQEAVLVHELPGFASPSLVQLVLSCSGVDKGIRKRTGVTGFQWTRTPAGWETVEDILALACDRYWDGNGSLDLEERGDAHVILGGNW